MRSSECGMRSPEGSRQEAGELLAKFEIRSRRVPSAVGATENSPALQCRESKHRWSSPVGTTESLASPNSGQPGLSAVPTGLDEPLIPFPALKCWAIFKCPYGTSSGGAEAR